MATESAIMPEDDGLHITEFNIGDFEWWYFDVANPSSGLFLKIVFHIGTDPLRTRIFPQLAISINTSSTSENFTHKFRINEIKAETHYCDISVHNEIRIRNILDKPDEYLVQINLSEFSCTLRFQNILPGWKPLGSEIPQVFGKRKSAFSWVIPAPKATVDGDFFYHGRRFEFQHAIGYHDHNYIRIDRGNPLYMDELIGKWYWGKAYTETYTIIFMDIFSRLGRTSSLMIADKNSIIHSSNNRIEVQVSDESFDERLKVKYASSLNVLSKDKSVKFKAGFFFDKMLDRRDLLNEVNPIIKWLIKKFIAKPAYHGIHSGVKLKYGETTEAGWGNYESMVFRG